MVNFTNDVSHIEFTAYCPDLTDFQGWKGSPRGDGH